MSHKNCLKRLKNRIFSIFLIPFILVLFFTFLLSDVTYAQTADEISLQGKIVRNDAGYEGLNVVNGTPSCVSSGSDTCDFQVKYYDAASSGTLQYTETFTDVEIGDYGGIFNLKLGSVTGSGNYSTLEDLLKNEKTLYLQIEFAPAGAGVYSEVFSRTALNASAYAISASQAAGDSFGFYNTDDTGEAGLNATAGAVYYNTDDDTLKLYNGSSWITLYDSANPSAGSLWSSENISSWTEDDYLGAGTEGLVQGLSTFSLDTDEGRASINTSAVRGGLTVYSAYTGSSAWALFSVKGEKSTFDGTLFRLDQDGTGNLIEAYLGSSSVEFLLDNDANLHLASNGIAYLGQFSGDPGGTPLDPGTGEGCIYAYGDNLYWDPACDSSGEEILNGGSSSSLWTDGSTFTYLTDTDEDLVLGASTTGSADFFFDVSEGRLGIGTDTPTAAIDIAGTSSTISNTSGDITITPAEDLYIDGKVGIGTDAPYYDLDILSSGAAVLRLTAATDEDTRLYLKGDTEWVFQNDGDGSLGTADYLHIRDTTAGASRMVFDTSGNVGIGTVSPMSELDVNGFISSRMKRIDAGASSSADNWFKFATYSTTGTYERSTAYITIGTHWTQTYFSRVQFVAAAGTGSAVTDNDVNLMPISSFGDSDDVPNIKAIVTDDGSVSGTFEVELYAQKRHDWSELVIASFVQDRSTGDWVIQSDDTGLATGSLPSGTQVNLGTALSVDSSGSVAIGTTTTSTTLLTLAGDFGASANNSYDIGTTSTRWKDLYTQGNISIGANGDSGSIRYNTTDNQLELSNNGSTWVPLGSATKTVTLSAEYPGAVLAADGSSNIGFMTSDAEGTANDSMNYYEWSSSETSLQDYDVRLRFTVPNDFAAWGTDAFTFNLSTESGSSSDNKVDFYLYEESSGTVDDSSTGRYMPAGTWGTTTLQGADLGDCNAAGETCLVLIRMYSANDNYVRVGDIDVNYTRKL